MAFRPKLSDVSVELRGRASAIRQAGNFGLVGFSLLILTVVLAVMTSGVSSARLINFSVPRWQAVPWVMLLGTVCDVLAIFLVLKGSRLQIDAKTDPVAKSIGKTALVLGSIGLVLILIGPFIFGWLLLAVGNA